MDATDALARWNRNLAAYVRLLAETSGGTCEERDGLVLFAGAHPYPGTHTNGVLRLDGEVPAEAALARADAFFQARRRSYTVWIRDAADHDLEAAVLARGYALHPPEGGMPAMSLDHPLVEADHPLDAAATMVRVEHEPDAVDFLRVTGAGFGMDVPMEVLARVFFDPRTLLDPRVDAYLARLDGEPAACCLSFVEAGYAGLYSGATAPIARGRGLGRATFRAAANAGLGRGARYTGCTSSDMGAPIWVRMGCEVLGHWRRYYGRGF